MTDNQLNYLVKAKSVHMSSVENPGSRLGQLEAYILEGSTGTLMSSKLGEGSSGVGDHQRSPEKAGGVEYGTSCAVV